jgi:hypothetical protein
MKIAESTLRMAAMHAESAVRTRQESVQTWGAGRRATASFESAESRQSVGIGAAVQISQAGRQAAAQAEAAAQTLQSSATATSSTSAVSPAESRDADDGLGAKLRLMKGLLEYLFGVPIRLFGAQDLHPGASRASVPDANRFAAGMRLDAEQHYEESEQLQFAAQGSVRTADGRDIAFDLRFELSRSWATTESLHFQVGQPPTDPLVLTFPGQAAQLTDTKFSFDLDGDGQREQISFVKPGSGFLVFDRNGEGQVHDGRELFGTRSGDGFSEMAALVADGNGWIDESDPTFKQLRLWTKDEAGQDRLQDLPAANVGALNLQHTATPFAFKDADNATQGVMRESGVYLAEDGSGAGSVSQIDLVA